MIEEIKHLNKHDETRIADLLQGAFEAYADRGDAETEARGLCGAEKVLWVKRVEGQIIGLVGAMAQYGLTGWELHPLLVDPSYQKQGVGRTLMGALEDSLRLRGALLVYLGTDDEHFQTSLSTGDLFDDLFGRIQTMRNLAEHPYTFYEKMGYHVVGVLPDANGWHKPDIMMAKRLQPYRE